MELQLRLLSICALAFALNPGAAAGEETPRPWAAFIEPDFPFFSSVLDARKAGAGLPSNNLTPRGLLLNLGEDCWVCFDIDLLRISAIWRGDAVTPVAMAPGSYHVAGVKAPEGQDKLPTPRGDVWLANGIYPGWQTGQTVLRTDPRPAAPDPREVGRGPLPWSMGRFRAARLVQGGVSLEYEAAGSPVREWFRVLPGSAGQMVERRLLIHPCAQDRWLVVGFTAASVRVAVRAGTGAAAPAPTTLVTSDGLTALRVPAGAEVQELSLLVGHSSAPVTLPAWTDAERTAPARPRWVETPRTQGVMRESTSAYAVDNVALPLGNPWRRNVRLADVAFFRNGRAAAVTFDGDLWLIDGLGERLEAVRWRRFASGLHEPLSLVIRDESIVVFDRNGLWRLGDSDGNGEADIHELISNGFAQTAETREFATSMKLAPDGSFIIAKGGQQGSTTGRHNGTVLQVSADGAMAEVLGHGLRMPFLGVHPRTGLVTASDQQGHYVPATPIHIIRDAQFYGFLSLLLPREQYPAPIAQPLTWIPHPVNPSGVSQVWLVDARLGPLNDALIHLGYYRPELFLVRLNHRGSSPQAAVMSLTRDLAFPPLGGAVNPGDGALYIAGFQIWGSEARQISGLARLRHTGRPCTLPREIAAMKEGLLLRFDVALNPDSVSPASFAVERWNYRRTASYGSPHFKLDGTKGQEVLTPSSTYLAADGHAVFVGIPDLRPVQQMRLGWSLYSRDGLSLSDSAYFTPAELPRFDPIREGFAPLVVDLTPRPAAATATTPITAQEGQRVANLMGCVACHSTDGSTLGKVGPSWKGLFESRRALADGTSTVADEAYLRESIKNPPARVVAGFDKSDTGMPSYEGVLTDAQIEALVQYLKTIP